MEQFVQGQRLTANKLNSAFEKVGGPMNPSNDYQWTKTDYGNLQTTWNTFIQSKNQNPDTLEIGVGYSKIGSERVVEIDGKKPAALRRVFINLGPLNSIEFPGQIFIRVPNIGDVNGVPFQGIIGLEWHNSSDVYFPGDEKLHFSLWNPLSNSGSTPSQWNSRQNLYTDDVYRGTDSRYWWWSGITLDRHQPEGPIGEAEGLDIVCFPFFVYYANQQLGSSTPEVRLPLLCVMLKQDYEGLRWVGRDLTGLEEALDASYSFKYPGFSIVGIGWENRADQMRILGRYVYSTKTQNAYYKTNLNYLHFDNDTSSCHFAHFSPVNSMYNVNRQVIYPFQWIDDSGKHHCDKDTRMLNVVYPNGTPVTTDTAILNTALACGWNKNTMSSPVLSCVSFRREDMMETSDPAQAILSGLFNDPSYGLSSETQKRLIWINNMDAMGVQYYDTCPDFRSGGGKINISAWDGHEIDTADNVSNLVLSSRSDSRVEWDLVDLSGKWRIDCGVYYV